MSERRRRTRNLTGPVLVLAAAALAACADQAAKPLMTHIAAGETYGYSEDWVSGDTYEVRYLAPDVRTTHIRPEWLARAQRRAEETAYDVALWRAAELSLQKGFPAFSVMNRHTETRRYIVGRDYTSAFDASQRNVMPRLVHQYSATYFKPLVTLTVELSREVGGTAVDAAETAARIERKYAAIRPGAVAPATEYYFGPSTFLTKYGAERVEPPPPERPRGAYRPTYVPYGPR